MAFSMSLDDIKTLERPLSVAARLRRDWQPVEALVAPDIRCHSCKVHVLGHCS
jgi:hypothetical protein